MDIPEHSRLGGKTHKVLLWTDALQVIPGWALGIIFAILAIVLSQFWPGSNWVGLAYFVAVVVTAVSLRLLREFNVSHGPDRASALALAVTMLIPVVILGLINAPPLLVVLILIGFVVIAVYATWIEPFQIEVVHQRKSMPGWNGAHPLRIVHIGDLHAEHFGPRERKLNKMLEELKPDLIVFTGDFINLSYVRDADVRRTVREIVSEWRAPLGVYAVSGTSPEVDLPDDIQYYLGGGQAESVVGRWATIEAPGGMLHIGGVATWHVMSTDRAALAETMSTRPEGGAQILLVHTPDLAPDAADLGIDLYLCGHTHAGQLCLPGGIPLMTASFYGRRFMRGRTEIGSTTVYTSRGLGFEGLGAPRARVFCRPEVTIWEITA